MMNDPRQSDQRPAPDNESSLVGLLRQLTREVPALFTKELALAKAELMDALDSSKTAMTSIALGGAVMLAGLLMLLLAAVYGLSLYLQPWLAALIVGVVVMAIGYGMVQTGEKKMEGTSLKPEKTLHSLNKDKEMLTRRVQ